MKITQLLTPITEVHWLAATDTVRDAFDHLESYGLNAAPLLDWNGCYVGTVTAADLHRHVDGTAANAFATALCDVERRSRNAAVTVNREVESLVEEASSVRFVPVVDDCNRLLGIVDRRRILDTRLPSAA